MPKNPLIVPPTNAAEPSLGAPEVFSSDLESKDEGFALTPPAKSPGPVVYLAQALSRPMAGELISLYGGFPGLDASSSMGGMMPSGGGTSYAEALAGARKEIIDGHPSDLKEGSFASEPGENADFKAGLLSWKDALRAHLGGAVATDGLPTMSADDLSAPTSEEIANIEGVDFKDVVSAWKKSTMARVDRQIGAARGVEIVIDDRPLMDPIWSVGTLSAGAELSAAWAEAVRLVGEVNKGKPRHQMIITDGDTLPGGAQPFFSDGWDSMRREMREELAPPLDIGAKLGSRRGLNPEEEAAVAPEKASAPKAK